MSKEELKKIKDSLYWETRTQRKGAWKEKDFNRAEKIRKKERENFEKWKFVSGLIKATEKQEKEQENETK